MIVVSEYKILQNYKAEKMCIVYYQQTDKKMFILFTIYIHMKNWVQKRCLV